MKTYIIYLAAGNSRRFKEDKLHALFKGKGLSCFRRTYDDRRWSETIIKIS